MLARALGFIEDCATICAPLAALACLPGNAASEEIVERLAADNRFDTVSAAIRAVDFGGDLDGVSLTFFAPTDEAFNRLPQAVADGLSQLRNIEAARRILAMHLVPGGAYGSQDVPVEMRTLSGDRLVATYTRGALTLQIAPPEDVDSLDPLIAARASNEARISFGDIETGSGAIIHGIDRVLLPPDFALDDAEPGADTEAEESGADEQRNEKEDDFVAEIAAVDDGPSADLGKEPAEAVDPAAEAEAAPPNGEASDADKDRTGSASAGNSPGDTASAQATDGGDASAAPEVVTLPSEKPSEPDGRSSGDVERQVEDTNDAANTPPKGTPALELTGDTVSVAELMGKPVRRADGSQLGVVGDLLVSLKDAQIETLVITIDEGLFGLGEPETRRVDVRSVAVDPLDGAVVLREGAAGDPSGDAE